ncbi:hypothetical protein [Amycolatopsis sp. NPDC051903]|uniref:hypothetical protein n=1 Tax=Amycolatopsis sp. NPDC051903 TaxID=3363936 RepID=UPI0037A4BBDA
MTPTWLLDTARAFTSLRGRRVESWTGVEMAFREDPPRFTDPGVHCLQLLGLRAQMDSGRVLTITTYQYDSPDDLLFGLRPNPDYDVSDDGSHRGSYRWRALTELPTGRVDDVATFRDEGVLAEIRLQIEGQPLLLIAGEFDETPEGGLLLHPLDDSVLAFTEPGAAERAPWTTPRNPTRTTDAEL